jgi:hypothetical protein
MIILIDSMEQHPFSFTGIRLDLTEMTAPQRRAYDAGQWDGSIDIETKFRALGAANGDYSLEGYQGMCHIERKSMSDAHGTILGWGERRERFQRELENLASMEAAAVIVECSFEDLLANAPEYGKKTAQENRKILFRQVIAWQQRYKVPWIFCDNRRLAELACYRWFKVFEKAKEKECKEQLQWL